MTCALDPHLIAFRNQIMKFAEGLALLRPTKLARASTILGGLILAVPLGATPKHATAVAPPQPISVSSMNYANTPWDQLADQINDTTQQNPTNPPVQKLVTPRRYVFAPGEIYEADLSFRDICRQLESALEKKGFINAADARDVIREPERIELILRVHCGQRNWRNPVVRSDHLAWRTGLASNERLRGSLFSAAPLAVAFDYRAGGNDDALSAAARSQATAGVAAGTPASVEANSATAVGVVGYDGTREFNLIVVDAFDYRELQTKGESARRLWTTFVAVPVERNQKFSEVLGAMLKVATPYFGENTRGLQVFNDARANVKIGEVEVIGVDVKLSTDKK